jgi:hypothetical protein
MFGQRYRSGGRILAVLLLLAGLLCLAQAQVPMTGAGLGKTPASAVDPATTLWVNAVNAAAGSSVVGATNKGIVDTLIKSLKTDPSGNLFTSNDRLWLLALADESAFEAQVDIISLVSWTSHGSFTLNANGFTGDGSTGFLDTGFIPSSAGGNFTASAASMSVAILTNRTASANVTAIGTNDSSSSHPTVIQANAFSSGTIYQLGGVSTTNAGAATAKGFSLVSQTAAIGAGALQGYLNGSSVASVDPLGGVALSQDSIYIGALHFGAGILQATTDQIVAAHLGGAMSTTQTAHFTTTVNSALTSLGKNVF